MLTQHAVDLVVHVGANVGQYGTALREGGWRGRILSFEPLGAAFLELQKVAAGSPPWTAVRSAVGSAVGTLTMNVSENSIFSSALPISDTTVAASADARYVGEEQVAVATLDQLLASESSKSLAVKIDVQGFERPVFEGATKALQQAVLVEVELSPAPVYEGQMLLAETVDLLAEAGFVLSLTENLLPDWSTGRALQFNGLFARPT